MLRARTQVKLVQCLSLKKKRKEEEENLQHKREARLCNALAKKVPFRNKRRYSGFIYVCVCVRVCVYSLTKVYNALVRRLYVLICDETMMKKNPKRSKKKKKKKKRKEKRTTKLPKLFGKKYI